MRDIFKPNFVKSIEIVFICLLFETSFIRNLSLTLNSNLAKGFICVVMINY